MQCTSYISYISYISVKKSYYTYIFNNNFNLGFGNPKSDTCARCTLGEDADHLSNAQIAVQMMKADRSKAMSSTSSHFITFDLQKTMPLPKLSVSVAFYLRNLWLYNFGVHLVNSKIQNGYMQIWSEDQASRGCEEIISALLTFFNVSGIEGDVLYAWSDQCAGQNKNFFLICLWQYLIAARKFKQIEHKFPEVGHSYMDSDRDFGIIEKKVRLAENIYSAGQYRDLILASKQSSYPFVITDMTHCFLQGKLLPSKLGLIKRLRNTVNEKVNIRLIK